MYNAELNNRWIKDLNNYTKDKRVLILGNSLSVFADKRGDFIDSFDVVIRVGKGLPFAELQEYVGKKLDVWSFGVLRSGLISQVRCKYKIFNFLQVYAYSEHDQMVIPKFMFDGKYQIYKDYFLIGSYQNVKSYLKLFPKDSNMRISQGLATILFFLDKIKTHKELHLFGFDFFNKSISYQMDNETKYAHSWHIPRSKIGLEHPHFSNIEKSIITRFQEKQLLTLHETDQGDVDKYVINNLFTKFRPEALKE